MSVPPPLGDPTDAQRGLALEEPALRKARFARMHGTRAERTYLMIAGSTLLVAGLTSGCSSVVSGDEPPLTPPVAEQSPVEDAPVAQSYEAETQDPYIAPYEAQDDPAYGAPTYEDFTSETPPDWVVEWTCYYSPTYNYDWHDDVLCTNGTQQERPYLRSGDSFVTETEMREAAREYERQLNAR